MKSFIGRNEDKKMLQYSWKHVETIKACRNNEKFCETLQIRQSEMTNVQMPVLNTRNESWNYVAVVILSIILFNKSAISHLLMSFWTSQRTHAMYMKHCLHTVCTHTCISTFQLQFFKNYTIYLQWMCVHCISVYILCRGGKSIQILYLSSGGKYIYSNASTIFFTL